MLSCMLHPKNGRGYPLELIGPTVDYIYQEDGSPWTLDDIIWDIHLGGFYWVECDEQPTLVLGRDDLKRDWSWSHWVGIRRAWSLLLDQLEVEREGEGFSFNGGPEIWNGWYCVNPQGVQVNAAVSAGLVIVKLAYQLEKLVPGIFPLLFEIWGKLCYKVRNEI